MRAPGLRLFTESIAATFRAFLEAYLVSRHGQHYSGRVWNGPEKISNRFSSYCTRFSLLSSNSRGEAKRSSFRTTPGEDNRQEEAVHKLYRNGEKRPAMFSLRRTETIETP